MSYSDKLRHPRWQRRRLEIFQRDNWTCQKCGDIEETLMIHHIIYNSKYKTPWDYPDDVLITLCDNCHKDEHVKKDHIVLSFPMISNKSEDNKKTLFGEDIE